MSSDPFSDQRPDDRELEDFLAGRHPLSRAYRDAAQQEGAPPELDADILAAARDAARQPIPRRRPRWLQPMAFAATLALGVAALLQLRHEPAVQAPLEVSVRAPASNPEAAKPLAAPLPQTPASERRDRAEQPAPKAEDEEVSGDAPLRRPQVAGGASVPPIGAPSSAPAAAGAPVPAPSGDAVPDPAAPPPLPAAEASESEARRYSAVPAPGSAQATERELMQSRGEDASRARRRVQLEEAAKASPEPLASPGVDGQLGAAAQDEFEPGSPQDWFARIRARLREDDPSAARALLRDFRKAYPEEALPPDLEALDRQRSSDPPD